jgi:signal transduction histidine kinase
VLAWVRSVGSSGVAGRYLGAVGLTISILAIRLALDPVLGTQNNRHLLMLPGVMVAAWFGGFGPGALAVTLDAVALAVLFNGYPQRWTVHVGLDLVLFLVVGAAVAGLVNSLRVARARADAAREARDQMLAIVVHDLRNPLNVIRLASGALKRMPDDADALRRRLAHVDRSVDRMERLLRDLVDATRIEHDNLGVALQDESLDGMLLELADAFRPLAGEKNISFDVRAAKGDVAILADRDRLTQAFGNLLGNALKFTPAGGAVTLRARVDETAVHFEVEDTGPGIPQEDLPRVFERYWKSRTGGGTGLGLFIARSIVAAHGGSLAVESRVGRGSTFLFDIPRATRASTVLSAPAGS